MSMGGGRPRATVLVAGLIAAQLVAASLTVVSRSGPSARATALVRADPPPTTTTTTAVLPTSTTATPPAPAPARPVPPPPPGTPASRLQGRLDAALGPVRACLVVRDGANELYARNADAALAPASTQKLLVAAAALDQLGPDFRFETRVVAPAPPKDGSVDSLWLVGAGDPLLATPEYAAHLAAEPRTRDTPVTPMAALADRLAAAGVHSVPGGIHGDDTRYERLRFLPGWKPSYRDDADVGPVGALVVNSGLDAWKPKDVLTPEPATRSAAELARLLVARGAAAGSGPDQVAPAGGVVLARIASAPLSQVVAAMLRSSDNLAAELLVRELDRHRGGAGTTAGGTAVATSVAQRLGLPTAGLRLADGSGLDPSDRASCRLLLAAIELADRPGFGALGDGLAVAGVNGTLAKRYGGTPLAGRLAAKTGWIDCAAGMVGRVTVHNPLRFSLLVNGPCDWPSARAVEDRVATALATYPES
jgi:serine-type D-Ala-D-Ala carboxypeptidase/endopeptidase (penicillin-binding protein 4)